MSRVMPGTATNYLSGAASSTWQTLTAWTISAWVYPTAGRASAAPICCPAINGRIPFCIGYGNEVSAGNNQNWWVAFWTGSAWQFAVGQGSPIALNTWHHLVGSFDGGSPGAIRNYRNGTEGSSNTVGNLNGNANAAVELRVGRRWDSFGGDNDFFPGRIAELTIWDLALGGPSDQHLITALAQGCSPLTIRRDHIVAYWPLFGSAGSGTEADFSGNRRNLSMVGTVSQGDHASVQRMRTAF